MDNFSVSKDIVIKKINEIKPYVRNPRSNEVTVEKLVKLIPLVGFNVPLVIDQNGVIVKGHARFKAGIRLGMEEFPCIVSTATDEQNKLDRISDNRISEFSEWIMDSLQEELKEITMDVSELELTPPIPTPDANDESVLGQTYGVVEETPILSVSSLPKKWIKVMCEKCGHVMFIENDKNLVEGVDAGKEGGLI